MAGGLVGYIRVGTRKPHRAALGLDAQRQAVQRYADATGAKIAEWYYDVEAGKRPDRSGLARATECAKRNGTKVVIARLDRLVRDAGFTATLIRSDVDFVCCDNPHANKATLQALSAFAGHEAEQAGLRTRAALAAARARGVKLGSSRPGHWSDPARANARLEGVRRGSQVAAARRTADANDAYKHLHESLSALWGRALSLRDMAAKLNEAGERTRTGKLWNPVQVGRVLKRMKADGLLTGEPPALTDDVRAGRPNDAASSPE